MKLTGAAILDFQASTSFQAAPAAYPYRSALEGVGVAEVAEELVRIDLRLRFALFGLECALGVSFAGAECERVFHHATEDQVSAKRYAFFESARLTVTGRVDQYEPDSVRLEVRGGRGSRELLGRVVESSEFHAIRLRQSLEEQRQGEPGAAPGPPGM
jgi:hypothetical protein